MRSFVFLLFLSAISLGFCQQDGAISIEVGGVGGFGSISYSQEFKSWEHLGLEYRAGLSFVPIDQNNGNAFIFPLLIHATLGSEKHFADFGWGQAITITTRGNLFARMPLSFGYRFQSEGHLFYRFAYTPIISYLYNFQWEHWGGVTIGYNL